MNYNYNNVEYYNTSYGGTGYQHQPYKWSKYESKFPNSSTLVTFHMTLDPRTSLPTDIVRITGNLDEMTNWGDGIELGIYLCFFLLIFFIFITIYLYFSPTNIINLWKIELIPDQPFIRQVSINLPYSMNDFCHLGNVYLC
jgi:hypothetical protein